MTEKGITNECQSKQAKFWEFTCHSFTYMKIETLKWNE